MSFKALKTENLALLTKGKRSQSALEYMMTYGWAILIIVIVAVMPVIFIRLPVESPILILNTPLAVHSAVTLPKPEKPVTVDETLELGLKIPIE